MEFWRCCSMTDWNTVFTATLHFIIVLKFWMTHKLIQAYVCVCCVCACTHGVCGVCTVVCVCVCGVLVLSVK